MNILLIEDEKKIASFVRNGLKAEGYGVDCAHSARDGVFMASECQYDLIVLDLKLGDGDGVEVCRTLRKMGRTGPIMMLTARDSVSERVLGLDSGADDYMTKPFSFEELLARIRAMHRRFQPAEANPSYQIDDLHVEMESRSVRRGGRNILLSGTEFRLLAFMLQNTHRVVSKSLILEKVWGYDFSPESNIIEVYIKYLREKIDKGQMRPLIHTIHGVGYRLCVAELSI